MSEAKHTPGPWTVDALNLGTIGSIETIDGNCIAQAMQMVPTKDDPTHSLRKANARLIAAAPEMYDALKDAEQLIFSLTATILNPKIADHIPFGLTERAQVWIRSGASTKAIAKAEGRNA